MTRRRGYTASWLILVALGLLAPTNASAQSNVPVTSMTPPTPEQDLGPLPSGFESAVSFLDSAVPRSVLRFRFDADQFNRRPTRAEYLFPADGFHLPETRVHAQELNTQVEFGLNEWFSTFLETPYKWINPDQNANVYGFGDLYFGGKFAGYNTETLMMAFQLRIGAHTSQHELTGTGHWSVEPSLLLNWQLAQYFTLEGQVGYWVPIGGTDFAGDVLKYGLGLSYGQRNGGSIGLTPVAEVIGWTVTGGKEMFSPAPGVFVTDGAAGDTIINGALGLRFTLGQNADLYGGYSRCLIGHPWFRDTFRVEFRLFY